MKIVHVTQYFHPEKGYQENSLAIEQIKLGYDVTIICSDDLTLWAANNDQREAILNKERKFVNETGIKIIRVKKIFKISARVFAYGIRKEIRGESPKILFLHGVSLPFTIFSLFSLSKGSLRGVKVIIDDHMVRAGSFNPYSSIFYKIFSPCFRLILKLSNVNVSKWVAVSSETKDFMIKNYGIKDEIELIPLGYNEKICSYDPIGAENWRIQNDLPSKYRYILYIGKCDNYKNPIDLFSSFKKFQEANTGFALLIVGEVNDEYRTCITEKAVMLNISDKIFIKPPVKNLEINKVLSLARMVIWPHGSSMTMLEAMACNCPVIAPKINVNLERLSHLRGLMFENLDDDLLKQMMDIENKREEIISNAKKWVNQFTWESINREFLKDLNCQ